MEKIREEKTLISQHENKYYKFYLILILYTRKTV